MGSQVDIYTLRKMFPTEGSGTHSWCFCEGEDCCLSHGPVESYQSLHGCLGFQQDFEKMIIMI